MPKKNEGLLGQEASDSPAAAQAPNTTGKKFDIEMIGASPEGRKLIENLKGQEAVHVRIPPGKGTKKSEPVHVQVNGMKLQLARGWQGKLPKTFADLLKNAGILDGAETEQHMNAGAGLLRVMR